MKKIIFILSILVSFISFCSCSEQDETSEYENWEVRNKLFIDSISNLAKTGKDGWSRIVAYNYVDSIENIYNNSNHYIYIQKIENGEGDKYPMFNDSVRVHYLGRMIPTSANSQGYVFDKTYNTYILNEETDVPAILSVRGTVTGFATAMLNMREGDRWKVVIPSDLGYGKENHSNIPGFSTLIFDVKMARIYRYKIDTNSTWH
ncbi:MAG: FKBP-type peptidyl-prolyl cis-trans isomerase [Bacteroidaceae bacterium]|nr:FKBP-type peptidyl-prolyl cis-trans isomerase [Bacteroidaceae bacterium]